MSAKDVRQLIPPQIAELLHPYDFVIDDVVEAMALRQADITGGERAMVNGILGDDSKSIQILRAAEAIRLAISTMVEIAKRSVIQNALISVWLMNDKVPLIATRAVPDPKLTYPALPAFPADGSTPMIDRFVTLLVFLIVEAARIEKLPQMERVHIDAGLISDGEDSGPDYGGSVIPVEVCAAIVAYLLARRDRVWARGIGPRHIFERAFGAMGILDIDVCPSPDQLEAVLAIAARDGGRHALGTARKELM